MTDVSEAEVEAAAKTLDPDAWDNAKTAHWSPHMVDVRQRNARNDAFAALTAAAQVRAQVEQKFVDDFVASGGRIIPSTEPDTGPSVLGIKRGEE